MSPAISSILTILTAALAIAHVYCSDGSPILKRKGTTQKTNRRVSQNDAKQAGLYGEEQTSPFVQIEEVFVNTLKEDEEYIIIDYSLHKIIFLFFLVHNCLQPPEVIQITSR